MKLYQMDDPIRIAEVLVYERVDGSLAKVSKEPSLRFREMVTRAVKEKKQPSWPAPEKACTPPKDHLRGRGYG